MNITVTHTIELSPDTKSFLQSLFQAGFAKTQPPSVAPAAAPAATDAKERITGNTTPWPIPPRDEEETSKPQVNKRPPGEACSKIGGGTKDDIQKTLSSGGKTAADISKAIKKTLDNTLALLALLWQRDLVMYDGEKYTWVG